MAGMLMKKIIANLRNIVINTNMVSFLSAKVASQHCSSLTALINRYHKIRMNRISKAIEKHGISIKMQIASHMGSYSQCLNDHAITRVLPIMGLGNVHRRNFEIHLCTLRQSSITKTHRWCHIMFMRDIRVSQITPTKVNHIWYIKNHLFSQTNKFVLSLMHTNKVTPDNQSYNAGFVESELKSYKEKTNNFLMYV